MIRIPFRTAWAACAASCVGASLVACNLTDRPGLNEDPPGLTDDTTGTPGGAPRPNHAPTLGLGAHDLSMLEGESKLLGLKAHDEDGDPIKFSIPNLDSLRALFPDGEKAIAVSSAGDSLSIVFTPGAAKGNYRFRILVSDSAGASEEQTVTISVGKVNRPPTVSFAAPAAGTSFKVREGATLRIQAVATDPDGDGTSLLALSNPPWPRCGSGSYDPRSGNVTFAPGFQCVASGETTFADLVFRAQDNGKPSETGQIAARITVVDSNSAPRWKSASAALSGKEGAPMVFDLKPQFAGDAEDDAVSFSAACGAVEPVSLRWTYVPGFRDSGHRECAVTASDAHHPAAVSAFNLSLDIADSVRKVDVAILSPVNGAIVNDSVVAVAWTIGDRKQTDQVTEKLAKEGPNVIVRSYLDSLGNYGADSVTVIRDTQGPLPPVINAPALLNIAFPRWTWHGGGGGDGHFRVRLDNADPSGPMLPMTDTVFFSIVPLIEGKHELFVQERDAAGNWSPVASAAITLDLTAPAVKILSPAAGTWTNATSVDVRWTVDGAVQTGQATETLAADGPIRITRFVVDAAGNRGADSVLILRRSAAGAPPLLSGSPSPTRNPQWTWATGGSGGTGTYRLGWSDGVWFATVKATRYQPAADIAEGPQTLYVSESDSAGNWSTPSHLTLVIDRTPPKLAITSPAPEAAVASADPALGGTLDEANGAVTVRWSGTGVAAGQAQISGPDWTLPPLAIPAGDVTLTLTPVDAAGNAGDPASIAIHKRPGVAFVRKGASGKGTSWQDAFGEIWQAVPGGAGIKEIWVADGEYATSKDGAEGLAIPSGVSVYGGFPALGAPLDIAARATADPQSILACSGSGFAVSMSGNGSVLDGFRIDAAGVGLLGDSGNTGRNLIIAGAGGGSAVEIAQGENGKTFLLEHVSISGSKQVLKAAVSVGAKAKVQMTDCSITGNAASDAEGGGGIWLDKNAKLTAEGLVLSGNTVADTAGASPRQMRVEDKAMATVKGEVEGDAAGIWVVKGGKATLNGDEVPAQDEKGGGGGGGGIVIGL